MCIRDRRYALWIAEYNSKCNYGGTYGMWQYSSTGKVSGVSVPVDMDSVSYTHLDVYKRQAYCNMDRRYYSRRVERYYISLKWG